MKLLMDLGIKQAVLPPQPRPSIALLRRLGFTGEPAQALATARREAPELLAAACSASSMWAANSATVCPSSDSHDGKVHIAPANLISELHRSIEAATTARTLRAIFADQTAFTHHPPLPAAMTLRDEGAANHTRLCESHARPGIHFFVFGCDALQPHTPSPKRYPARQTRQASAAIARMHGLSPSNTVFAQQHPAAIDAGVFHNDVAAVGNLNLLLYHELAWLDEQQVLDQLHTAFARVAAKQLITLKITQDELPLNEAVTSYLFNSQLVQLPDASVAIICPEQCRQSDRVQAWLGQHVGVGKPITQVYYVDLRQSMANGGGPACLRLRIVLTEEELARVTPSVILTNVLYDQLVAWVHRHYRDMLSPDDLVDPALHRESAAALAELSKVLNLPHADL